MESAFTTLLARIVALNALPQLDAELIATVFNGYPRAALRTGPGNQPTAAGWQIVPFYLPDVAERTSSRPQELCSSWRGRLASRWPFASPPQPNPASISAAEPLFQTLELRQQKAERRHALLIAQVNPRVRLTRCAVAPRFGLARAPLVISVSWFRDMPLTAEDLLFGEGGRRFRLCWQSDPAQTHWYLDRLVVDTTGFPGPYDSVLSAAPRRKVHLPSKDAVTQSIAPMDASTPEDQLSRVAWMGDVGGTFSIPAHQTLVTMATSFPHDAPPSRLRATGATMHDVFSQAAGEVWAVTESATQPATAGSSFPCAQCPHELDAS